jgi:hypothetical protein
MLCRYAVEAFKLVVLGPPCPMGRLQWVTVYDSCMTRMLCRYAVEAFKLVVLGPPCPMGRLQWVTVEGEEGHYEGPLAICLATAHNAAVSQFPEGCAAPYGAVSVCPFHFISALVAQQHLINIHAKIEYE